MKKTKQNKTASRLRYEREHPTVSFRISRDLQDRLQKVRKAEGKSIADILRIGVGLLEVKVRQEEQIREGAYEEGMEKGYELAFDQYSVSYPCSVCGKSITVESEEEKEFITRKMREARWGHADCLDRKG